MRKKSLKSFEIIRQVAVVFYLIIESIFDFLYQFFLISLTILISLHGNDLSSKSLIWCKFKFFSTNYRLFFRQLCTMKLARIMALITICLWLLHSVLCTFFVNIAPSIECIISNPVWVEYVTVFFYLCSSYCSSNRNDGFTSCCFLCMLHLTLHHSSHLCRQCSCITSELSCRSSVCTIR